MATYIEHGQPAIIAPHGDKHGFSPEYQRQLRERIIALHMAAILGPIPKNIEAELINTSLLGIPDQRRTRPTFTQAPPNPTTSNSASERRK